MYQYQLSDLIKFNDIQLFLANLHKDYGSFARLSSALSISIKRLRELLVINDDISTQSEKDTIRQHWNLLHIEQDFISPDLFFGHSFENRASH